MQSRVKLIWMGAIIVTAIIGIVFLDKPQQTTPSTLAEPQPPPPESVTPMPASPPAVAKAPDAPAPSAPETSTKVIADQEEMSTPASPVITETLATATVIVDQEEMPAHSTPAMSEAVATADTPSVSAIPPILPAEPLPPTDHAAASQSPPQTLQQAPIDQWLVETLPDGSLLWSPPLLPNAMSADMLAQVQAKLASAGWTIDALDNGHIRLMQSSPYSHTDNMSDQSID